MADVAIMIAQIQYLLGIPDEQIEETMKEKLNERINKINQIESLKRLPDKSDTGSR